MSIFNVGYNWFGLRTFVGIFLYYWSAISRLDGFAYVSLKSVAHLQLSICSIFFLALRLCSSIIFLWLCGVLAVLGIIRSRICLWISDNESSCSRFHGVTRATGIKLSVVAKNNDKKYSHSEKIFCSHFYLPYFYKERYVREICD